MKVLVVKTTSLGDVIHTLPAVTDAVNAVPKLQLDWVVEQPFAEIPHWHPGVNTVIPVAIRRWRKQPIQAIRSGEWQRFYNTLRAEHYDLIIDAQGLVKSAVIACLARGKRAGFNRQSAREPLASWFYHQTYAVARQQHAVTRVRQLFAAALGYAVPQTVPDYGLDINRLPAINPEYQRYIILLHGTTWATKHWPEQYWQELAKLIAAAGYQVLVPWGNEPERERAERITARIANSRVLPKMGLLEVAAVMARATAVVAVDTGLGHLAAALNVPSINLYGPTNPVLTGTAGAHQIHLAADFSCAPCLQKVCTYQGDTTVQPPCFARLPPASVWAELSRQLAGVVR